MDNSTELKDIKLEDITPFLHCLALASTRKQYSLDGMTPRFIEVLDAINASFPPKEAWTAEEMDQIAQYITNSDIEAVIALPGDKGVAVRNAYFSAVVTVNWKTLTRYYMRGRDAILTGPLSDKEYEAIFRDEYTALAACTTPIAGRKEKKIFTVMGYLLTHYPLPAAATA